MAAREIVTIQCGHFSNFIGTHWWNVQESEFCYDTASKEPREILHDCLFREGLTLTGEQTYTPRLVAIDLPGSLRALREEGVLYDTQTKDESPAWLGGVDVHESEAASKNEYLTDLDREEDETAKLAGGEDGEEAGVGRDKPYHLDDSVKVWSDFLRLHLHSKSLLMVPGHVHNDANDSFAPYPSGTEVWEDRKFQSQLEDRLHFFVEECDLLQGFHLLSDWTNGFGGLAGCIAQDLRDEYGSKGILTVLSSHLDSPLDKLPKFYSSMLNHLLALHHLCGPSSLLLPLSLLAQPWRSPRTLREMEPLSFSPSLSYHSSALYASALETATLFYRTEHNLTSLPALSDTLTAMGRKICSVDMSLPLLLPPDGNLASQLDLSPLPSSLSPLSPFAGRDDKRWSQALSLRGLPSDYPLSSPEDSRYTFCHHPTHILAAHLAETAPSINSQLCCVQKPLPLATPFPHILPDDYMTSGHTPVVTSLQTQAGTHQLLSSLLAQLRATKLRKFPAYSMASSCLDEDSREELVQSVSDLAQCYSTGEPLDSSDSD